MGTETRTQALWGAAGEKTLQCAESTTRLIRVTAHCVDLLLVLETLDE